jgi:hypothetical protein
MYKIKLDKADMYFSQYIRLRDRKCMRCGSPVKFNDKGYAISHQNSHFQGRGKEATRFDPLNCDTLCPGCHQYFTANPGEHYQWQVKWKGQTVVDQLILQSNIYHKKDRKAEAMYWRSKLRKEYNI